MLHKINFYLLNKVHVKILHFRLFFTVNLTYLITILNTSKNYIILLLFKY